MRKKLIRRPMRRRTLSCSDRDRFENYYDSDFTHGEALEMILAEESDRLNQRYAESQMSDNDFFIFQSVLDDLMNVYDFRIVSVKSKDFKKAYLYDEFCPRYMDDGYGNRRSYIRFYLDGEQVGKYVRPLRNGPPRFLATSRWEDSESGVGFFPIGNGRALSFYYSA